MDDEFNYWEDSGLVLYTLIFSSNGEDMLMSSGLVSYFWKLSDLKALNHESDLSDRNRQGDVWRRRYYERLEHEPDLENNPKA